MKTQTKEQVILLYVRGYWLTRYLVEKSADLFRDLLAETSSKNEIENCVAEELNISRDRFWQQLDPILTEYFQVHS